METTGRFTLPRTHILRSKTDIDALLERGAVLFRYPIKAYYLDREMPDQVGFSRMMVSVPKRNFKRAVKRNLLKRRIREAYRVRKITGVDILFQYNSPELADFATISAEVASILARIRPAGPTEL